MNTHSQAWDDSARESLRQMLRRGRGAGFLAALQAPSEELAKLLVECITGDFREDKQMEDRWSYYAQLALRANMDLGPLADHLRLHDDQDETTWNARLTVRTLGEMSRRGNRLAAGVLEEYVSWGYEWTVALEELGTSAPVESLPRLAAGIEARFPDDRALDEALKRDLGWPEEWAVRMAGLPGRLGQALSRRLKDFETPTHSADPSTRAPKPNLTALATGDLLNLVDPRNSHAIARVLGLRETRADAPLLLNGALSGDSELRWVCIMALRGRRDPTLLDHADRFLAESTPGRVRGCFLSSLQDFPAAILLPRARVWLTDGRRNYRLAAHEIFEFHAEPGDVPQIRAEFSAALGRADWWTVWHLARALTRLSAFGPFPELDHAFEVIPNSSFRWSLARALQQTDPRFGSGKAFECLWDCERFARELACEAVELSVPGAVDRLRELAADRHEDKEVREKARHRLESAGIVS